MNPRPSVAVVEDNPPQRMILCKLLAFGTGKQIGQPSLPLQVVNQGGRVANQLARFHELLEVGHFTASGGQKKAQAGFHGVNRLVQLQQHPCRRQAYTTPPC